MIWFDVFCCAAFKRGSFGGWKTLADGSRSSVDDGDGDIPFRSSSLNYSDITTQKLSLVERLIMRLQFPLLAERLAFSPSCRGL